MITNALLNTLVEEGKKFIGTTTGRGTIIGQFTVAVGKYNPPIPPNIPEIYFETTNRLAGLFSPADLGVTTLTQDVILTTQTTTSNNNLLLVYVFDGTTHRRIGQITIPSVNLTQNQLVTVKAFSTYFGFANA